MKPMRLEDILFSQGFGTRRVCAGLVQQGYVSVHGEIQVDPGVFFDPKISSSKCRAQSGLTLTALTLCCTNPQAQNAHKSPQLGLASTPCFLPH
jgi:hypothetical protein